MESVLGGKSLSLLKQKSLSFCLEYGECISTVYAKQFWEPHQELELFHGAGTLLCKP